MNTLQIQIPEGHEIDTVDVKTGLITFKKKEPKRWKDNPNRLIRGYWINHSSEVELYMGGCPAFLDKNIFATKKQALSALAKAQLSQIIANDPRFGGPINDKEWQWDNLKYIICRLENKIERSTCFRFYYFLAFHTPEQRDLFLEENEDLIKQYFMI